MAQASVTPCPTDLSPLTFEAYREFPSCELEERVGLIKERLSESLLILGHHYQQDEVIKFADLRGDSFKLSQLAAQSETCRWIVFCGVHFMAETADVLARDDVEVYLPDMAAGCSMADMADIAAVEAAWEDLGEIIDTEDLMPVTYVNSSADVKAFCGRRGGVVCTSSNARAVLEWSLGRRQRVFFFPDQHLGVQHRPADGHSARGDVRLGLAAATRRKPPRRDQVQPHLALEGPLLGPPDVQARARRAIPPSLSRGTRPGTSRMHDVRGRSSGPHRLD